jgi:hypothetical protein
MGRIAASTAPPRPSWREFVPASEHHRKSLLSTSTFIRETSAHILIGQSDGSGKVVVDYDRISFARHGHTGPRQSKRSSRCHALAWQSYPATLPDRQSVANLRRNYYRICVARHGTMDPLDPNKKFRTGE